MELFGRPLSQMLPLLLREGSKERAIQGFSRVFVSGDVKIQMINLDSSCFQAEHKHNVGIQFQLGQACALLHSCWCSDSRPLAGCRLP